METFDIQRSCHRKSTDPVFTTNFLTFSGIRRGLLSIQPLSRFTITTYIGTTVVNQAPEVSRYPRSLVRLTLSSVFPLIEEVMLWRGRGSRKVSTGWSKPYSPRRGVEG